jgi:hypothetical protein
MDWGTEISRALGVGGGLHFLTTFLLDRWRKKNNLQVSSQGNPQVDNLLQYPTSTADTGNASGTTPAGLAFTLYSLDSSLGADVALSVAAALLSPSSRAAGAPALAGAYGGAAAPLAAGLAGFLVGQTLA